MVEIADRVKKIKPFPAMMEITNPKKPAIDERLILRLYILGFRIIIYKTRR